MPEKVSRASMMLLLLKVEFLKPNGSCTNEGIKNFSSLIPNEKTFLPSKDYGF